MHHSEKKSFKLPCGKTVAQSWGGLRKAWLGFKIALANHDSALMTHYASFISKVQVEMGVQVTKFDPEILDEPEDSETIRACDYEQPSDQIAGQELDYDSIMENARGHLDDKHEKISEPRQNLFSNSRTGSRNACWHSRSPQAGQVRMESDKSRTIHGRKICIYELVKKRPRQYEKEYSETQEVQEEGDSSYTSSSSSNQSDLADADDEWQDEMHNENYEEESSTTNRRRSCSYKLKG